MVVNYECDWSCNNPMCNWDNLRCVKPIQDFCAPGCPWDLQYNEVCNEECNVAACDYDNGECVRAKQLECAKGCTHDLLRNDKCDQECNNPDCSWDAGLCRCGFHCEPIYVGTCLPPCMILGCGYDHFGLPGGCTALYTVAFTLMQGLIVRDLFDTFYYDDCARITNKTCGQGVLRQVFDERKCNPVCNLPHCSYSMGMCMAPHPTCLYGHDPDEGTCIWCRDGYHNYMGYCVPVCPHGSENRTYTHKMLDLCYNSTQVSDEQRQDKLYVFEDDSIQLANVENKYSDLMDAFVAAWELHTTIYLVGEEIAFNPQSFRSHSNIDYIMHPKLPDVFINARWKYLTITSLPCSQQSLPGCAHAPTTLQLFNLHNNHIENKTLIFCNLTLSMSRYFEFQRTTFCPFQFVQGEKLLDDHKNQVSDEDIAYASCTPFQELSLFTLQLKGGLQMKVYSMQNVTVANITVQLQSLVFIEEGHVFLENVHFVNIQPYSGSLRSSAVFLQTQSCLNISACGSFTYRGGSVTYINNGYEYRSDLVLNPFIKFDSVTSLEIAGVTFSGNVMLGPALSFISVRVLVTMRLSNCNITRNFFGGSFVSLLSSPALQHTQGSVSPFSQTHITFEDLTFAKIFAKDTLLRIVLSESLLNVKVAGCSFEEVALNDGVLLEVRRRTPPADSEINGSTANNTRVPARWFNLSSCYFRNVTSFQSLISLTNLANLHMSDLTVEQSGDAVREAKTAIMRDSLNYPFLYMKKLPAYAANTKCAHLVSLYQVVNSETQNVSITRSQCLLDGVGFTVSDSAGTITFRQYRFSENTGVKNTALQLQNVPSALLTEFEGRNNTQVSSGLIGVLEQSSLEVRNSLCLGNIGQQGTCIHAQYSLNVTVSSSRFISNIAPVTDGGAIYVLSSLLSSSSLQISDCEFVQNSAFRGGAIAVTANVAEGLMLLQIIRCVFRENSATTSGSGLFTDLTLRISNHSAIDSCTFSEERAVDGVAVFSHGQGRLELTNSLFHRNTGTICSGVEIETGALAVTSLLNVTFLWSLRSPPLLKSSTQVTSTLITSECHFLFSSVQVAQVSGIIWSDESSEFSESNATAIELLNTTAAFHRSVFSHNSNEINAGAVLLEKWSTFSCAGCSFLNNSAGSLGGALFADQSSQVELQSCTFSGNSAVRGSAMYLVLSQRLSGIANTTFSCNFALQSAVIYGYRVNLRIHSTLMRANQGPETPGLVLLSCNLTVTESQFLDQSGQQSAFLVLAGSSSAWVSSSSFSRGTGVQTSVADVASSGLSIFNSSIAGCSGQESGLVRAVGGSAVALVAVSAVATPNSGTLVTVLSSSLVVGDSHFASYTAGGIAGEKLQSLVVYNSTFSDGRGTTGSALSCSECEAVAVSNSSFYNNTAREGTLWLGGCTKVIMDQVMFSENQAEDGGALYLLDTYANITNSKFQANSATSGGAILTKGSTPQSTLILISTSFQNNVAKGSGGAIKWNSVKPLLHDVKMARNQASYGPDIASFPVALNVSLTIANQSYGDTLVIGNVAAGQPANSRITAQLLDHYGQRVVEDSHSEAKLVPVNSMLASVSGSTHSTAASGEFAFNDFAVFAKPGTTVEIELSSAGLPPVVLAVTLRDCRAGESATPVSCSVCGKATYSLDPDLPCQMCPKHAVCPGKNVLLPQSGYWRARENSTKLWECPYQSSCLGGTKASNVSATGYCADGYEGNMCQSCSKGYFRKGANKCLVCPSLTQSCIVGVVILLAIAAIVAVLVWAARKAAMYKNSVQVAYFRLLVNYSQVMFILTSVNLNWPNEAAQISHAQEDSGNSASSLFSIDCFLLSDEHTGRYFYEKKTFAAIFPVGLFALISGLPVIVAYVSRRLEFPRHYSLSSIIVIYFLVYPTLATSFFQLFSCLEIEKDEYWLFSEMSIRCWTSEHYKYMFALGIPSLAVWVLGLPLLCLLVLRKSRKQLQTSAVLLKFSFLVSGYKPRCYYWELWILLRKAGIVACSVFIKMLYRAQALTISFILILGLFSQYKERPFTTEALNQLEFSSIATEVITVYAGLYYLTNASSEGGSLLLFALVVIANLVFLVGWVACVAVDAVKERARVDVVAGDPEVHRLLSVIRAPPHSALLRFPFTSLAQAYRGVVRLLTTLSDIPTRHCSLLSAQPMNRREVQVMPLLARESKKYSSLTVNEGSY